ncbi:hypothetical protein TRAPUB_4192 [Trametes pubescens]|uniref:Heterokaryon incompatibility domain-containing protein n=1 Tax=Trametes pubescens TaxID=154538 RepID=A0A1M2VBK4_TRAPU|nr:hypothetical protein TRAPUB_4192 [Trametes pubescens]
MDIVVDDSDMHYHFYHEVLQHVRTNPHPNYFTCPCATSVSMWTDVFWNGPVKDALRHCQSFGTLINLLVDKFPDIDQLSTEAFLPTGPDSDYDGAMLRSLFGTIIDIPWFGAAHDGFPYCNTMSSYTRIRQPPGACHSRRDDAALWVSALTFGFLEAATRTRIPESMFVVPGPREGEQVLSGSRIHRFLMHFYLSQYRDDNFSEGHPEHGRQIAELVKKALSALDEEAGWHIGSRLLSAGCAEEDTNDVVCAIAFTVLSLCGLAGNASAQWQDLRDLSGDLKTQSGLRSFHTAIVRSCQRRMERAGWCINSITDHLTGKFMNYVMLSNLVQLQPYIRSSITEHEHCTPWACVFYTFPNTDEYVPRHINATCRCDYIRPPIEEVMKLLREGAVPVVVYDGTLLRVRPAAQGPYVAISHVWADGMGSTTEDGLPTCVVKRIASLVQGLLPEVSAAFWMDSLCVPDHHSVRKRAIQLMERTYRDAAKVLVIDQCIRAQCSERKPWEENLFRIATSGWIRRVWTLQEGILARELYFEFQEGPVNVEEKAGIRKPGRGEDAYRPWDSGQDTSEWAIWEVAIYVWCLSHLPFLWFRVTHGDAWRSSGNLKLDAHKHRLISLLSLRSATKAEDETIAISGMLGLDLGALLAITGPDAAERQMRDFFIQLKHVPTALAVLEMPRLELPGFSWAPRSLTMVGSAGFQTEGPYAEFQTKGAPTGICTAAGLLAKYFVAPLRQPCTLDLRLLEQNKTGSPPSLAEQLVVCDEGSGTWYLGTKVEAGVTDRSHFITFDALLFVYGALPGPSQTACCAAVCSVAPAHADGEDDADSKAPRGGSPESGTSQLPQRFHHVASVVLMMVPRKALEMTRFGPYEPGGSGWEPPRMSALSKRVILLT